MTSATERPRPGRSTSLPGLTKRSFFYSITRRFSLSVRRNSSHERHNDPDGAEYQLELQPRPALLVKVRHPPCCCI